MFLCPELIILEISLGSIATMLGFARSIQSDGLDIEVFVRRVGPGFEPGFERLSKTNKI